MSAVPGTKQSPDCTWSDAESLNLEEQLDRLRSQLAELRGQLRHAQHMATMGTMVAMVAHEFNNLMTPILSYVPHALHVGDPKLMTTALERTLKQVQRAKAICDRLLAGPSDGSGPTCCTLSSLVEEAIEFLVRDLAKDRITLQLCVPHDLRVRAQPALIQQVITNLVINARQAMAGRPGRLTISASPGEDGWVWLHIQDSGEGIAEAIRGQIFQPFVSTKLNADRPEQRGIGLGLALCREIVEEHGGQISFQSEKGKGTTFSFSLPAVDSPGSPTRRQAHLPSASKR